MALPTSTSTTTAITQQYQYQQQQQQQPQQKIGSNITATNTTVPATTVQKQIAGLQFSWVHFLAGGTGGMAGALVTSPLDVVKTRLQSSLYKSAPGSTAQRGLASVLGHIKDTCLILGHIYTKEGPRALYKGLGPNLVGVIPARAINFATYGNGKKLFTELNHGKETTMVHLSSAATAGVVTATMTNPIWLIKTRMQLQQEGVRQYRNSLDCIVQILRMEGIRGLYKGLSASYLGVAEGTIQWVIYEQLKTTLAEHRRQRREILNVAGTPGSASTMATYKVGGKEMEEWVHYLGAAGVAKFVASAITYPHEVLRTRLRQVPMKGEAPKYTGLKQTFQLVLKEEGVAALYGGLTAHMMRVVPNAAIMFFCYEAILHHFG
ncbi:hypothetical protein DFQ27_006157 [Actinomortierella ambigua]|uniref:Mitochondrial carrier n=1 Tax=Actinomortierella ambigua TaxID=1343610 RepID=A0A9P6QH36_9FUNG|nr:hypothetical protein DFQ27_006157 [Actinomortierella ambigua]